MNWLEVSLTVNGELAEAVADVLARFAFSGVMMEQGVKYVDDEDAGTPTGPITVRAYLEMDDRIEERRQKLEESLYYLGRIQPLPTASYKQIADQNWMEAWKQHYKPILIGERLLILPAWMDSPDPNRIAIRIDPGMAFGTGLHPTTRGCLTLLQEISPMPPVVLDVGSGSGILALAALRLGAERAVCYDTDPLAVDATLANAKVNGLQDRITGQLGSLPLTPADAPYPLVLANLVATVLVELAESLAAHTAPGGRLLASGIIEGRADEVLAVLTSTGFALEGRLDDGEWVSLQLRHSPAR